MSWFAAAIMSKACLVSPGVPSCLHPLSAGQPANRLALARWLVDSRNPLMGRVVMNRMWAQLFGRGIVETGEDFGVQGEPPSHPELLDWLATEFFEQRLSLKAMQRLIVTSATYRQSSRVTPFGSRKTLTIDCSRGDRVSGWRPRWFGTRLSPSVDSSSETIGGPSVFPYQPEGIWFAPYSGDRWIESREWKSVSTWSLHVLAAFCSLSLVHRLRRSQPRGLHRAAVANQHAPSGTGDAQ